MSDMTSNLNLLAKNRLLAQSRFNMAYCQYWHTVAACSDELGWKILEVFRSVIEHYSINLDRRDVGIKQAAWEVFRLVLVSEADYTFEEAERFVKWYRQLKSKIGNALAHLFDFHGDGFEDICDSYPLAGRELVERALASHPKSDKPRREGFLAEREILDSVLEGRGLRWHKLLSGENYVVSLLEDACKKCYLRRVLPVRGTEAWTDEERRAVEWVLHGEDD